MTPYEILLLVAGVAGAIFTIYKTTALIVEKVKKCIGFFKNLQKQIDVCERHTTENYMRTLQLVIMSHDIPIEERLQAGEKYIKNGGNGQVKAKYAILKEEYEEQERIKENAL